MLYIALFFVFHVLGAEAALRRFNFTLHSASRFPGTPTFPAYTFSKLTGRIDGFERQVYLINGQQPGPLIEVDEGDDIEVAVQNDLEVETTLHWHGGNFTYRFSTQSEYGFYWYHSHFRTYYNDAIRGPLLIRPAAWRQRPFEAVARNDGEKAALVEAERQATNILLNDWTHELSDVIFARYTRTGAFPSCVDSILANGLGRVECLPKEVLEAGPGLGIPTPSGAPSMPDMPSMGLPKGRAMHDMPMDLSASMPMTATTSMQSAVQTASGMPEMPNMDTLGPRGCMPPMMFKPGFNMSSLPPETCTNTSSPLLVVPANQTTGWLALNLVNSGAVSALRVSLDGHSMLVYAADGLYVALQRVKVGTVLHMELGQRYSVMVKLDQQPADYYLSFATYPSGDMQQVLEGRAIVTYTAGRSIGGVVDDAAQTWMYINGSAKLGAARLQPQDLAPFEKASSAPPDGPAHKTLSFVINQTDIVTWVLDRAPFKEPQIPVIYGNVSSGWTSNTTMRLPLNSTIDIILNISNDSMDTMGHPLHLHGHKFWVLGSGTGSFAFPSVQDAPTGMLNLVNPPFRDTTGLPAQGWAVIRLFEVGMAVVLVEGQDQLPALVGQYNKTAPPDRSGGNHVAAGPGSYLWLLVAIVAGIGTSRESWLSWFMDRYSREG
ncbi:Cupredoxin [Cordyceps militaris CM01]|uniref:Cupredoxin n=1 Tax=Cordyceps militaris (strain CM01) TaxID=983644 RepID=G3J2X4_CORMM|nr:Cupredoxin [Cordyceps militaris CM01]EGX97253.1 Cupredoxin [Cordyceps militaris CM01]